MFLHQKGEQWKKKKRFCCFLHETGTQVQDNSYRDKETGTFQVKQFICEASFGYVNNRGRLLSDQSPIASAYHCPELLFVQPQFYAQLTLSTAPMYWDRVCRPHYVLCLSSLKIWTSVVKTTCTRSGGFRQRYRRTGVQIPECRRKKSLHYRVHATGS